jgi:hypothetical protein
MVLGYSPGQLIGHQLLPIVPCTEAGARLPQFKADMMQITATNRALRAMPNAANITVSYQDVSFEEHALRVPIDVREQRAAAAVGSPVDPMAVAARKSKRLVALGREYDIAVMLKNPANYAPGCSTAVGSGSAKWDYMNNGVSSVDIIAVWKAACETIRQKTGMRPNIGWMGARVWEAVQLNTLVLGRWRYAPTTGAAPMLVSAEMFCQAVGLEKLYIGNAVYSADGLTISGDIWEDCAGLMISNNLSVSEEPTFGLLAMEQFGTFGTSDLFGFVSSWVEPGGFITNVAYVEHYKPWVAMNSAGYLWTGCLT